MYIVKRRRYIKQLGNERTKGGRKGKALLMFYGSFVELQREARTEEAKRGTNMTSAYLPAPRIIASWVSCHYLSCIQRTQHNQNDWLFSIIQFTHGRFGIACVYIN